MKLKHLLLTVLCAVMGIGSSWAEWTDITNGNNLSFTTKVGFGDPAAKHLQVHEIWTNNASAAFDLNQNVAELPAGIYELSANAMYRASLTYGTPTNCVIYATIGEKTFSAPIKNFGDGTAKEDPKAIGQAMVNHNAYSTKIPYIIVEASGAATIGMKTTGALTYCTNGYWFIYNKASFTFKNVTAAYFTKLKEQATAMVDAAQAGDAKTALNNALTTYNTATVANVKGLRAAIESYLLAAGTDENPIDVTSYIENPSFEGGKDKVWIQDFGYQQPSDFYQPSGWDLIYKSAVVNNTKYQTFNPQTGGAKDGNCLYVRHRWSDVAAVEDLRQSVCELPAGKYKLTVAVKGGSNVRDANTLTLKAGNNTNTTTINNYDKTNYKDYSVTVIKTDAESSLDICYGLKQTAYDGEQLFYIDDFRLEYLGDPLKGAYAAYATANEAAKAVDLDNAMFADYKTALQTAIATYGDKTYNTVAAYQEAISALETATTNATNSIKQYADNAAALAAQKALIDGTNVYAAGWTTGYVANYDTKKDAYDNRTLNEALVNPTAATGHRASTAYNDLLTPWTIGGEACNNFDKSLYINTWSTEANNKENGSGMFTPFFEYWTSDGNSLGATNIATTVTGLADGYYKVDILTRVRIKNNGGVVAKGITLSLNDNEDGQAYSEQGKTCDDGTQFRYATLTAAAQVEDGSLKINFNVADGNNISWLAFKNVMYSSTDKAGYDAIVAANSADRIAGVKVELKAELDGFKVPTTNIGDGAFLYPTEGIATVNTTIAAAQAVYDAANATLAQVNEQIQSMKDLTLPPLNAPAADQKFNVVLTYAGYEFDNKAMTYIANGRNDMGNYNIQYLVAANANYAQAFTMTKVEGNKYKMSQIDNDGTERYISTGVPYGGNTSQIRTTTDAEEALVVEVIATANEGVYNLKNTEANQYIGSQDAGVYTVNSHINFNLVEAEKATANLVVTAAKYGTFIAPFDAEKPEGVTLYTCDALGDNNVLTLEDASTIKANTPYIVYSESPVEDELSGWGLATKDTYTSGLLTGMYKSGSIEAGNYILQNQNGNVAFYIIAEGGYANGQANRCYLTVPEATSARLDIVIEGETGINDLGTENGIIVDGKYMQNNKVVIVKNGRKYNVTGQIVK